MKVRTFLGEHTGLTQRKSATLTWWKLGVRTSHPVHAPVVQRKNPNLLSWLLQVRVLSGVQGQLSLLRGVKKGSRIYSSMAEQEAVNFKVVGSSPARSAILCGSVMVTRRSHKPSIWVRLPAAQQLKFFTYLCYMDKYFRTESGKLVDILDYSIEQVSKNSSVKIHIGTDSQVYGPVIWYTICIVYRYGQRGAHFIYKRIKKPRPPRTVDEETQIIQRLSEEVYMTMEVVQHLLENSSLKIEAVEFDFNNEKDYISNKITSMATGWAKGLGLNARIKPDEMIACKAADHICRRS